MNWSESDADIIINKLLTRFRGQIAKFKRKMAKKLRTFFRAKEIILSIS